MKKWMLVLLTAAFAMSGCPEDKKTPYFGDLLPTDTGDDAFVDDDQGQVDDPGTVEDDPGTVDDPGQFVDLGPDPGTGDDPGMTDPGQTDPGMPDPGQTDTFVSVTCPPPEGTVYPLGGCCVEDAQCESGFCVSGFCSATCTSDGDCGPSQTDYWPAGTMFYCADNQIGFNNFCAPGSLQACGADGDAPCPDGEVCTLLFNPDTTVADQSGMIGRCTAKLPGGGEVGDVCDQSLEDPLQCNSIEWILYNCIAGYCISSCEPGAEGACPDPMECVGPMAFDVQGLPTQLVGGGFCTGPSCGTLTFTGDSDADEHNVLGDAACPAGTVCDIFGTSLSDDTLIELRCFPEDPDGADAGGECWHDDYFDATCKVSGLCLQESADIDPAGALCASTAECNTATELCVFENPDDEFGRCSPAPDPGFCAKVCINDADCDADAACVDLGIGDMDNGEPATAPVCYPLDEWFDGPFVACEKEADCAAESKGCLALLDRSEKAGCGLGAAADTDGATCTETAECGDGEYCIEDFDTDTKHCTAAKLQGEACLAEDDDCLSGFCYDKNFEFETDAGDPTNTFCVAPCTDTADCAANQVCAPLLLQDNGNEDDSDDVHFALCRPLPPADAAAICTEDTNCTDATTGDTCDVDNGACYTTAAVVGAACVEDHDCGLHMVCYDADDGEGPPGGYCTLEGCTVGANETCPGAEDVCVPDGPAGACYEGCTVDNDCARVGEGYSCMDQDGDGTPESCFVDL